MKSLLLVFCMFGITGCNSNIPTYQQLVDYPVSCSRADEQLKHLKEVQQFKNFNPDPDFLSEEDRAYNGRLKATIWWYAYRCNKS